MTTSMVDGLSGSTIAHCAQSNTDVEVLILASKNMYGRNLYRWPWDHPWLGYASFIAVFQNPTRANKDGTLEDRVQVEWILLSVSDDIPGRKGSALREPHDCIERPLKLDIAI